MFSYLSHWKRRQRRKRSVAARCLLKATYLVFKEKVCILTAQRFDFDLYHEDHCTTASLLIDPLSVLARIDGLQTNIACCRMPPIYSAIPSASEVPEGVVTGGTSNNAVGSGLTECRLHKSDRPLSRRADEDTIEYHRSTTD